MWRSSGQASLDVPRDVVDVGHTLNSLKNAPLPVVGENWGGLPVIGGETVVHGLLIVVGAAREPGAAAGIADALSLGLLEPVVITLAAFGTGVAAGDALDQSAGIDPHLDHVVEPHALAAQHPV